MGICSSLARTGEFRVLMKAGVPAKGLSQTDVSFCVSGGHVPCLRVGDVLSASVNRSF